VLLLRLANAVWLDLEVLDRCLGGAQLVVAAVAGHTDKVDAFVAHVVHEAVIVLKRPVLQGVHGRHRVHGRRAAGVRVIRIENVELAAVGSVWSVRQFERLLVEHLQIPGSKQRASDRKLAFELISIDDLDPLDETLEQGPLDLHLVHELHSLSLSLQV
jgi:hypothetical protein